MSACQTEAVQVRDLRCGDVVHVEGYFARTFGPDHWTVWGPAFPSYPVPGKWMVTKLGQGTHAVFGRDTETVDVCERRGPCASELCGYCHPRRAVV